ncbi:MAG TPA: hypothetical protein VFB13_17575 [Reyranella sp.]|jgi:hypothetical protein|nr:hypothetical protein [Reyranella sp.]
MLAAAIAGQIIGRLFDPIGWIVMVGAFFAFRGMKLNGWLSAICAAVAGAIVVQVLLQILAAQEQRHPDFLLGLLGWVGAGLVECGIATLIAKGVRAMRQSKA